MKLHTLDTNIGVKVQRMAFQGHGLCQPQVVELHHSSGASERALKIHTGHFQRVQSIPYCK